MTVNEGTADRIVRVVVGLLLIAAGFFVNIASVLGVVLALLGVVVLITAATCVCLVYKVFGISTCPAPNRS